MLPEGLPYLQLVVGFIVAVHLFHSYLDFRQLKAIKLPAPPKYVAEHYTKEGYSKAQAYSLDKWWYGQVKGSFDLIVSVVCLVKGFLPYVWALAGQLLAKLNLKHSDQTMEIWHTIMFFLVFSGIQMVISMPWSAYYTFVLEEKHGFNKQTFSTFVTDFIKQVVLGLVMMPPILAVITWILQKSGPFVALYLWGFTLALSLFFMTIYPTVIAPLFNKFTPLQEGELRNAIEKLAGSLQFPLTKLYVVDGSRRSAHSNAYMYGFFNNKRIVLYDTLLDHCGQDQVVAVLAHELGHWKLWHTPINFVFSQVVSMCQFLLFTAVRASPGLYASFGFVDTQPAFMAFIIFNYILAPVDEVLSFLTNVLSRRFEFQADNFAVTLGYSEYLKEALLSLDKENKSTLNVDPWYSAYHYSHPPLVERLKQIDRDAPTAKKVD